jgi:ATP-binding cassette subfamily B (MDR/TAP) protein 1
MLMLEPALPAAAQAAISEKMSTFIKMVATFLAGIIIAFVRGWDMTLVMLAVMPLMVAVASSIAWITTHATAMINDSYGKANSVAQQSLSQIRTVAAFGQEAKALEDYGHQLELPERVGIKLAVWNGAAMGSTQLIMFSAYAVAFVYGAWRVSLGLYTGGQVLNVLFAVIMGGFQLGMVGGGAAADG